MSCNRKYKAYEIRKRWDGMLVCDEDWEPRHPQDFVRGIPEKSNILPFSFDNDGSYTGSNLNTNLVYAACTLANSVGVADIGVADCMVAGTSANYTPGPADDLVVTTGGNELGGIGGPLGVGGGGGGGPIVNPGGLTLVSSQSGTNASLPSNNYTQNVQMKGGSSVAVGNWVLITICTIETSGNAGTYPNLSDSSGTVYNNVCKVSQNYGGVNNMISLQYGVISVANYNSNIPLVVNTTAQLGASFLWIVEAFAGLNNIPTVDNSNTNYVTGLVANAPLSVPLVVTNGNDLAIAAGHVFVSGGSFNSSPTSPWALASSQNYWLDNQAAGTLTAGWTAGFGGAAGLCIMAFTGY